MPDEEKVKAFADMVDGVEKLVKPIQDENIRLHEQIDKIHKDRWRERIVTGICFAVIGICFLAFILLAYLSPVEMEQGQNLPDGSQTQSYSEGATGGK